MPRWMEKGSNWEDGKDRYLFTDFELGVVAMIWLVIGLVIGATIVLIVTR